MSNILRLARPNAKVFENWGNQKEHQIGIATIVASLDDPTTTVKGHYDKTSEGGKFTFLFKGVDEHTCSIAYQSDGYFNLQVNDDNAACTALLLYGQFHDVITTHDGYHIGINPVFDKDLKYIGNTITIQGNSVFFEFTLIYT